MAYSIKIPNIIPYICMILLSLFYEVTAEYCTDYGHRCTAPQKCCSATCCVDESYYQDHGIYRWSFWNMWYFWFIIIFILMSCFGGCGYWRRRQWMISQQGMPGSNLTTHHLARPLHHHSTITVPIFPGFAAQQRQPPNQEYFTATDVAPPIGNFPSPPPYAEVISKPDIYPVNKNELPPYPGLTDTHSTNMQTYATDISSNQLVMDSANHVSVPGLPAYTPANQYSGFSTNQNDCARANQQTGNNCQDEHRATQQSEHGSTATTN